MKTSYVLIGLGAVVVLYLLVSRSNSVPRASGGTTYSGNASWLAAAGAAAQGLGKGIASVWGASNDSGGVSDVSSSG